MFCLQLVLSSQVERELHSVNNFAGSNSTTASLTHENRSEVELNMKINGYYINVPLPPPKEEREEKERERKCTMKESKRK